MRNAATLVLLLVIVVESNAADIASVEGEDIKFKGLTLGAGVDDVIARLGPPKERLRYAFENGPEEKLFYVGWEFWIEKNAVEAVIINGQGLMLDSGLTIGSLVGTGEGIETLRIGDSDCFRATERKEGRVVSIRLSCAN